MKFTLMIYQPHPFDPKALSPEEHKAIGAGYGAVSSALGVTPGPGLGFAAKAIMVRVTDGQTLTATLSVRTSRP